MPASETQHTSGHGTPKIAALFSEAADSGWVTHIDGPREGELGEEAVSLGVERPDDAVVVSGRHSGGAAATEFRNAEVHSVHMLLSPNLKLAI